MGNYELSEVINKIKRLVLEIKNNLYKDEF